MSVLMLTTLAMALDLSVPRATLDEGEAWCADLVADDPGAVVRVYGLPPGAEVVASQPDQLTLCWTPDFTQGGGLHVVRAVAKTDTEMVHRQVRIHVVDTIAPPAPILGPVVAAGAGYQVYALDLPTDGFLEGSACAGTVRIGGLSVPDPLPTSPVPVRVKLHGAAGYVDTGEADQFVLHLEDAAGSAHYGYPADSAFVRDDCDDKPRNPPVGPPTPFAERRVIGALDWVMETWPDHADAERVWLEGGSMGATGVFSLGLAHARHFVALESRQGAAIYRHFGEQKKEVRRRFLGDPAENILDAEGMGIWDRLDASRALLDSRAARDLFLTAHHSKDDPAVLFGVVAAPSEVTGLSVYETLAEHHVGHFVTWDEGNHGHIPDGSLSEGWWGGWDPMRDPAGPLRRDQPFPAFSQTAWDQDPGDGTGVGIADPDGGYAGDPTVAGDTLWSGDVSGTRNRALRWDPSATLDTLVELRLRLHLADLPLATSPGVPDGDWLAAATTLTTVTPRGADKFRCYEGESIDWTYGALSGTVVADADGVVTIADLPMTVAPVDLVLSRVGI
jgi:hypothetical protein